MDKNLQQLLLALVVVGAVAGLVLAVNKYAHAPGWKPALGVAASGVGVYSAFQGL